MSTERAHINLLVKMFDEEVDKKLQQGPAFVKEGVVIGFALLQVMLEQQPELDVLHSMLCALYTSHRALELRVETLEAELENIRRKL